MDRLRQLIHEIHRRSLWQVLGIYLVASWAVLQIVDTLGGALNLPDWFPSFALALLLIGLPMVMATAFVQEGGPRRDADVARPPEVPAEAAQRPASSLFTWRNAIGGGVLAFAFLGFIGTLWLLVGGGVPGSGRGASAGQSIAVLPFVNMSGDPDNEYFSDGVTEELLNALAQLPDLRIPARTSSFAFKGQNTSITEIARALNVAHVLEGSVRRSGNRVLITAQLVDAVTDTHIWSDTYERDLVDIFSIQREVAAAVANELQIALIGGESVSVTRATLSPEAYDLYLRGRAYWRRPGYVRQDFETAIDLFQRAVALDPDFTLARAALSVVHSAMYWRDFGGYDTSAERLGAARSEAEEALRRDPDLPEAHLAMGYVLYWGQYDLRPALEEFERAQRLDSRNVEIMEARGFIHRRLGEWSEAVALFEEASALDPRDPELFANLGGQTFLALARWPEAIEAFSRALALVPEQATWRMLRARSYVFRDGRTDSLRAVLASFPPAAAYESRLFLARLERDPERLLLLADASPNPRNPRPLERAWAHRLRGDDAAATRVLEAARAPIEQLVESQEFGDVRYLLGITYAGLGLQDEAARVAAQLVAEASADAVAAVSRYTRAAEILAQAGLAEEAVQLVRGMGEAQGETSYHGLRLNPIWDPIRDDPRFQELMASRRSSLDG